MPAPSVTALLILALVIILFITKPIPASAVGCLGLVPVSYTHLIFTIAKQEIGPCHALPILFIFLYGQTERIGGSAGSGDFRSQYSGFDGKPVLEPVTEISEHIAVPVFCPAISAKHFQRHRLIRQVQHPAAILLADAGKCKLLSIKLCPDPVARVLQERPPPAADVYKRQQQPTRHLHSP